jgi:hypothetical protein
MSNARLSGLALLMVLACAGCSTTPANVAGMYSVSLANDANGCMFQNWDGMTSTNVPLELTQNGTAVTATVGGAAGGVFDFLFGSHVLVGSVGGSHVDVVIHGTNQTMAAGTMCVLSLDAHASVDLVGDTLQGGTITYTYVTNHDSTCPIYTQTCSSVQLFNGTRPPTR